MILKTTEASKYIGVSINTIKTLANNGKIKSFKTTGGHRRFMQEDLDAIEYKDRIARFGYEYLWSIFRNLGIKVEIMENREKVS